MLGKRIFGWHWSLLGTARDGDAGRLESEIVVFRIVRFVDECIGGCAVSNIGGLNRGNLLSICVGGGSRGGKSSALRWNSTFGFGCGFVIVWVFLSVIIC